MTWMGMRKRVVAHKAMASVCTTMALAHSGRSDAAQPAAAGDFTPKIWALDTRLFRRDPLA